jgi:uncharacterized protein
MIVGRRGLGSGFKVWALLAVAAAVALAACGDSADPDADIEGTWLGSLVADGMPLRIVFNIEKGAPAASYTGTLDVPEQGYFAGPLTRVALDGRHLVVQIADIGASFVGDVAIDGASIAGLFGQGGQVLPLVLQKQPGRLDYRRPQDPVVPYPYESRDLTFTNAAAGITLAGTLTRPPGAGPFKAVVLVSGSGPNNRNEELLNHRPFLVLADALTRRDIATLRYDKRGVGQSTGDYSAATSVDFADDARAAAEFLRSGSGIPVSSVGLVGHSEGGLIAPMVADGDPDVAFLVLLAGPAVPGDEIIVSQQRAIGAADGVPAAVLDANEMLNLGLFACFRTVATQAALAPCLRATLTSAGVTGADQDMIVATLDTPWMYTFVTHDPAAVLGRTTVPVLAVTGSLDLQVIAGLNLPPMRQALQIAGNQRATVQELPGLNHLFQHATTGSPREYAAINETMAPELLAQVAAWIAGL